MSGNVSATPVASSTRRAVTTLPSEVRSVNAPASPSMSVTACSRISTVG